MNHEQTSLDKKQVCMLCPYMFIIYFFIRITIFCKNKGTEKDLDPIYWFVSIGFYFLDEFRIRNIDFSTLNTKKII